MFTYVNCTTFPSILQAKNAGFQKIPSEQPKYTFFSNVVSFKCKRCRCFLRKFQLGDDYTKYISYSNC